MIVNEEIERQYELLRKQIRSYGDHEMAVEGRGPVINKTVPMRTYRVEAVPSATAVKEQKAVEGAVVLSDEEKARVAHEADELFKIPHNTPQFAKYTDRFSLRVPQRNVDAVTAQPAQNVNVVISVLEELRVILGILFPADVGPKWSFADEFKKVEKQIGIISQRLQSGRKYLTDDIAIIDAQKEVYHNGIEQLRKSLVVATNLRQAIEERLPRVGADHGKAISENVIYYLVQREIDLLTELAVISQSYLAMDAARKTNIMLLQNMERVISTTLQAVSNAVFVANNVASKTLNFVMDTRNIVMGFEGKKIKEMIGQFMTLDHNINDAIAHATGTLHKETDQFRLEQFKSL